MHSELRDPDIPDGERTTYCLRFHDDAEAAGVEVVSAIERVDGGGQPGYRQHMSVASPDGPRYESELVYSRDDGVVRSESYSLETYFHDAPVAVEKGWFRDVEAIQFGGVVKPFPRSTTPLLGCSLALRGLTFEKGFETAIALYLANTVFWEVNVKVEKRERVDVPAGTIDAWRVRARPSFKAIHGTLDRIVGMILPAFVLHFDAEPTHRLLRFTFPTGPFPWNPRATVEATELG